VVGTGVVDTSTAAALLDAGHRGRLLRGRLDHGWAFGRLDPHLPLRPRRPGLVRLTQRAEAGFDRWSAQAERPMLINGGCVVTGTDLAGLAAARNSATASTSAATARRPWSTATT